MKSTLFALILVELLAASCRALPSPPKVADVPVNLPTAMDRAQSEVRAGHWGSAWALVSNQIESSPEKQAFLDTVQTGLVNQRMAASAAGKTRQVLDLDATLSLIRTGHWDPAPAPTANATSTDPNQWLKGTATVVVNKGLRKGENGTAEPDIVIGSGFFITSDGYLLTNHHVIESEVEPGTSESSRLSVRLPGSKGERLPARVVGWDRNMDLALLKVEYNPEFVFPLSGGVDPIPGQRLQAIGSPGGLESTLTEGIVSAVKRPLLSLGEVLQIDVAVNPGNSGGPLVNKQGQVVGVVFAGIRDFQGVNFAIPASLVRKALPRLQVGGKAVLPWIGVGLMEDPRGLEVVYVTPQSPADWAGVRVGDRLLGVAGVPVTEIDEAQVRLLDFGTDAVIPLDLERAGKSLKLWSTLGPRPDYPLRDAAVNDLASRVMPIAFGVVVDDLANGVDRSFRVKRVWAGTSGEQLSLAENDPLQVLDWFVDTKNQVLITRWDIKRRLGGYLESIVQLGTPFSSRLFL